MRRAGAATSGSILAAVWLLLQAAGTSAAVPHTVQSGETLSGIAAADGLGTEALAAANGLAPDAYLIAGETIEIPTESGVSATASGSAGGVAHTVRPGETLSGIAANDGLQPSTVAADNGLSANAELMAGQVIRVPTSSGSPSEASSGSAPSSAGRTPIYCPCGAVYLSAPAASAWDAMRRASLRLYGVDLYPSGTLGAFRSYAQQAYLYQLFQSGQGAPADPPSTSSHELGTAVDVATPEMRSVIDQIGSQYGWEKVHGPSEWWHVDYVG